MPDSWSLPYPPVLPALTVTMLPDDSYGQAVICNELPWWFAEPRAGDQTGAAWYDRQTHELTQVREMPGPAVDTGAGDGTVQIQIDEWARDPGAVDWNYQRITVVGALTPERAEFRSVTIDGRTTELGDPDFDDEWSNSGPRQIVDDGRYQLLADRRYHETTGTGMGAGLAEVTVGDRKFRCLRAFDLPVNDGKEEIGQPLIDLASGRTIAYWQYRPTTWDADSATWIADHPGAGITIDEVTFQRRNCTGRDDIALSTTALGLGKP